MLNKLERIKTIVLGMLIILSIYLYFVVFIQKPVDYLNYLRNFLQSQDSKAASFNINFMAVPEYIILTGDNKVSLLILSNSANFNRVVNFAVKNLKKALLVDKFSFYTKVISDDIVTQEGIKLSYPSLISLKEYIVDLCGKYEGQDDFKFNTIIINNSKSKLIFYFVNTKLSYCYSLEAYMDIEYSKILELKDSEQNRLLLSYSKDLGWEDLAYKSVSIPIEFENLSVSEVKPTISERKRLEITKKLFPDSLFTKTIINKDGEIVVTDERKTLSFKNDGSFKFVFEKDAPKQTTINEVFNFYKQNFNFGEDVYILSEQRDKDITNILIGLKIDGIPVELYTSKYWAKIILDSNGIKEIEGYYLELEKSRKASIKIDGISAIDTIKEIKKDIFIENINLKYIIQKNKGLYPYWEIKTDSGTVYFETIK